MFSEPTPENLLILFRPGLPGFNLDPFSNPTPRKEEVVSAFFLRQIGSLEDSTPGRHTVRVLRVSLPSPTPTPHTETPPHQETKFVVTSHCVRAGRLPIAIDSHTHPTHNPHTQETKLQVKSHSVRSGPLSSPRRTIRTTAAGKGTMQTHVSMQLRCAHSRAARALAFAPLRGALCVLTRHRSKPFGFSRVAEAVGRCARWARAALREGGGNR